MERLRLRKRLLSGYAARRVNYVIQEGMTLFWLRDIRWDQRSLTNAVEQADSEAALRWMREIHNRITQRPSMPIS